MLLFDTGKKLEKAFTKEQFDALVEVLERRDGSLATSQELKETETALKTEIQTVKTELKADVLAVKGDLRETELRLQKELKETELRLQKDIEKAKSETIRWTVGIIVAQTAAIIAALVAIMK